MNPGMGEISFGNNATHKKAPPHYGGQQQHFTYFLKFPNNQGTCLAVRAIIHHHNLPGFRRGRFQPMIRRQYGGRESAKGVANDTAPTFGPAWFGWQDYKASSEGVRNTQRFVARRVSGLSGASDPQHRHRHRGDSDALGDAAAAAHGRSAGHQHPQSAVDAPLSLSCRRRR